MSRLRRGRGSGGTASRPSGSPGAAQASLTGRSSREESLGSSSRRQGSLRKGETEAPGTVHTLSVTQTACGKAEAKPVICTDIHAVPSGDGFGTKLSLLCKSAAGSPLCVGTVVGASASVLPAPWVAAAHLLGWVGPCCPGGRSQRTGSQSREGMGSLLPQGTHGPQRRAATVGRAQGRHFVPVLAPKWKKQGDFTVRFYLPLQENTSRKLAFLKLQVLEEATPLLHRVPHFFRPIDFSLGAGSPRPPLPGAVPQRGSASGFLSAFSPCRQPLEASRKLDVIWVVCCTVRTCSPPLICQI